LNKEIKEGVMMIAAGWEDKNKGKIDLDD